MDLKQYIEINLPKTIRKNPQDKDKLIGMPYPYVVPCASGKFQEMYYWDTYFTNKSLILYGDLELAKNNVDNMCYLVRRFGFMPNGNKKSYLYNSQPPFLSLMVKDIYAVSQDLEWLETCYDALVIEYEFWMTKRVTTTGLNRYDWMQQPQEQMEKYAGMMRKRMGEHVKMTTYEAARALASSAESGWDITPRMSEKTYEYVPADLNSLLYAMEHNLSEFAMTLGKTDAVSAWNTRKEKRAELCREYLKNSDDLFMDYHFETGTKNQVFSPACFYPLYCEMATQEEAIAVRNALKRIETAYGILTCEKNDIEGNYQWNYPNGWAPLQLIVAGGLAKYGFEEDAFRIARKFVSLVENCFEETGHLWEKYNVIDGNANAQNEYEMPPMLGWTFGVYTALKCFLAEGEKHAL